MEDGNTLWDGKGQGRKNWGKKNMELLPKYFSPSLYHIIVNKVTGAHKFGL